MDSSKDELSHVNKTLISFSVVFVGSKMTDVPAGTQNWSSHYSEVDKLRNADQLP